MTPPGTPRFRELDRAETEAILARNHVGRIAFTFHDRVDIEPIHYVFADGVIVLRTSPGTKLDTLGHHPWVAFEVDEVEGLHRWRSVVVRGTAYRADPDGDDADKAAHAKAVARFREFLPEAFTADDPTAFRTVMIRIHPDRVTGRAADDR